MFISRGLNFCQVLPSKNVTNIEEADGLFDVI